MNLLHHHHGLSLSLLLLLSSMVVVSQTSNITIGSFLLASKDSSSSWLSPSEEFAFGFRTTNNDQNLYLLAIWYDKIPDKTIVWWANGDNPTPEGSKLELTTKGQFILTVPKGDEITLPMSTVVDDEISYAAMLDTGNFVLVKGSSYVWESFKNPTDTLLPTQVLEIGGKLTSKQMDRNYSRGRFQLRIQDDGDVVLQPLAPATDFAYRPYFNSRTANISDRMNSGYRLVLSESGIVNVVRRNGNTVNIANATQVPSGDFYNRVTLDFDGIFTQYTHPRDNKSKNWGSWITVWSIPDDICSDLSYNLGGGPCGYNGFCRLDANRRPICDCLPGFSHLDPTNKFIGCKLDKQVNCESSKSKPEDMNKMQELSNTFWPNSSNFEQLPGFNENDCSKSCLYDCNCVVAVINAGTCWKKKLPLSGGKQNWNTNGKALIKLPKFDVPPDGSLAEDGNTRKKDQATLILAGALLLGSSVFLNLLFVAAVIFIFLAFNKRRHKNTYRSSLLDANLQTFTYKDLQEATDGFKEELGRGAFGTVYKGVIFSSSSRTYVAVKKLDKLQLEGEKEFKTEASIIAKTHHKNLVRLLGFCDEGPNKLLVYEFMSNGTVASFLFGISRPDWNKRIQIASGIARGIMYLHEECVTQIIHCDIKPQNILLNDTFMARISDFGLAKLLLADQTRTHTMIRGTRGYVAPEWFKNTPITAKIDVYSYGVMLLEILFCRKSLDMGKEHEEEVILVDWVYDCFKARRLSKLLEEDEEARNDMKRLERLVMVALWCIQEDPSLRPPMKKVIQMLEGVVDVSVPPCPSPFSYMC